MRIHPDRCAAQSRCIHEAGMGKLIENDHVTLSEQSRNAPHGDRITAGETQGCLGALE